ncbi:MAG: HDOD domain-containing protein [Acidobacteria bacterium]|nr:HDOD domain-containing protein [Acidobacteriota bacterium]
MGRYSEALERRSLAETETGARVPAGVGIDEGLTRIRVPARAGERRQAGARLSERPWALRKLPPFPPVASKLMYLLAQDEVPLQKVAELIRSDSAFSAEVLRLANSPLFGARARISTISHALCMVGFGRLYSLVITTALSNFLGSASSNPLLAQCWRHSLACALAAEELAMAAGVNKDYLHTAGLLHDVGRLALAAAYPAEYARMIEVAEGQMDLLEFERDLFEIDHCEAGQWLVDQWMFPADFREFTGCHHLRPEGRGQSPILLLHAACGIASFQGFGVSGEASESGVESCLDLLDAPARGRVDVERLKAIPARISQLEQELLGLRAQ